MIATNGHQIDIILRADSAVVSSQEQFVAGTAIIDTGASKVCIDYRIAQTLNLRQIDQTTLQVVGGTVSAPVYLAELEVPSLNYKKLIEVVAAKVGHASYQALLGRSFLSEFIVTFDGPRGFFVFARPTPELHAPDFDD